MDDPKDRLIVALDVSTRDCAAKLIDQLAPYVVYFKVGSELMNSLGNLYAIELVQSRGGSVFYDAKFHDIPNTMVAAACDIAMKGIAMLNLHCLSGGKGMRAVRRAIDAMEFDSVCRKPLILGVTILTSHDEADIEEMAVFRELEIKEMVVQLAVLAKQCGFDGVVSSSHDIPLLRDACGSDFLIVTPGIRPAGSEKGDQARIATPASAIEAGADYIVVGRPILDAPDPVEATKRILDEIAFAL